MVLLSVVSFVEDEEIDLSHGDEGAMQASQEDICSADNDHILFSFLLPIFHGIGGLLPRAIESGDITIEVALEDLILLICQ